MKVPEIANFVMICNLIQLRDKHPSFLEITRISSINLEITTWAHSVISGSTEYSGEQLGSMVQKVVN